MPKGNDIHRHNNSCLDWVLSCNLTEHTHNNSCYEGSGRDRMLMCIQREHTHRVGSMCYQSEYKCGY